MYDNLALVKTKAKYVNDNDVELYGIGNTVTLGDRKSTLR